MIFRFRTLVQVQAAPTQRPAVGYRELALHASAVSEAAERFLRERSERKHAPHFTRGASFTA